LYYKQTKRTILIIYSSYHSPELVNKNSFTEQVDSWAAGVILYLMLTKKHPFIDESLDIPIKASNIKHSILQDKPNMDLISNNYSKQGIKFIKLPCSILIHRCIVKQVISNLLIKDPEHRSTISDCLNSNWVLINCDKSFYETYRKAKLHFLKERAMWFDEELLVDDTPISRSKKRRHNISYHPDDVEEDVILLKTRRGKREDDPECIFRHGSRQYVKYLHPADCSYINTQLDVGKEWSKRKLALYNKKEENDNNSLVAAEPLLVE
jgi:serine/threonine protein kinase